MNPETNPLQAMRSVTHPGALRHGRVQQDARRSTTSYGIASAGLARKLKICLEEKQKIYDENIELADHAKKLYDENMNHTKTQKPGSGGGGKRRTKRRRTKRRRTKRRRTKRRRTKRRRTKRSY